MVRVALVGVGGIAGEHLKTLSKNENVQIVSVCDIVKENAERAASQYGCNAYTNLDQMLDNEKIDGIFVCVPPFAHGDIEEKVAERGIHLLVEKPLGLDMEVVRKKAEAIKTSGIITSTGYCMRYIESLSHAIEFLQGKEIAIVRGYRFGGFPETPWWRVMSKSGGQLVEMTTHNVDLMIYLAGGVKKVAADMALITLKDAPGIDIPDICSVNMVFKSGALGHMETGFVPQPDYRSGLEIIGKDFRVSIDGSSVTILEKNKTETFKSSNNFYQTQDEAFIKAIMTEDRSLIRADYAEAMKVLEVTLAANESAKTGNSIFLNQ